MIRPRIKKRPWGTRNVMLLLGFHTPALVAGIARYAKEAQWELDQAYTRVGRVSDDPDPDGILALITDPRDYLALEPFLGLPIVDVSAAWIHHLPPKMRQAGLKVPRVLPDDRAIAQLAAQHFLERGFKNLAQFNFGNFYFESERLAEFRKTALASGAWFREIEYYKHRCCSSALPLSLPKSLNAASRMPNGSYWKPI